MMEITFFFPHWRAFYLRSLFCSSRASEENRWELITTGLLCLIVCILMHVFRRTEQAWVQLLSRGGITFRKHFEYRLDFPSLSMSIPSEFRLQEQCIENLSNVHAGSSIKYFNISRKMFSLPQKSQNSNWDRQYLVQVYTGKMRDGQAEDWTLGKAKSAAGT